MATLTGKITDVTSSTPENISSITVKAPSVRIGSGTDVIVSSPAVVDFNRDTGDITISGLTGGLSWLYIEGDGWADSIPLSVADGMITLVEAIANAAGAPGLVDYVQLLANLELAVGEVAQDAVDAAAESIKWHQDTPDSSWGIADFPNGAWKMQSTSHQEALGLPRAYGVLMMYTSSPDRQSVQNAKTAMYLTLSHAEPTRVLVRSTNNTGVWEPEWRDILDGYKPPTKQAAVPLTFPRGSSYSDDRTTLTIRIPFKFGAAVKRARLRLRNYDYRSDHGFPGSYRIVGAGIGKHQINDDGSMTGLVPEGESITQLMGSTQMAGPDEAAGDWVDIDLEANTDYLLSYSFTADDGMVYTRQTAQCFTNRLSSGWNRVGSVTSVPSNMAVLAAILDVEVLEDTPVYGYLGDSQTAAISAARPGYDSWAMAHSRLAGAIPTVHGHAGGGLNEWQDPAKPAYAISGGMAKFDRFHISMGSNDISGGRPFTGVQEYLTTAMANWRSQTDTFVLHNYLPRTEDNPTDTVRNALNDWIVNELPGGALYAVDVFGSTVDPDTGYMAEKWRGSASDVHMNTAGNARIGMATFGGTQGEPGENNIRKSFVNSDAIKRIVTSSDPDEPLSDGDLLLVHTVPDVFFQSLTNTRDITPRWVAGEWNIVEDPTADGALALQGSGPSGRRLAAIKSTTGLKDVEVVSRIKVSQATDAGRYGGLALRASGAAGNETGYLALVSRNRLHISKFVNGSHVEISLAEVTVPENGWYWLRFRAHGTELSAKLWSDGQTEPAGWTVTANDNSVINGGWVGPMLSTTPYDNFWDVIGVANLVTGNEAAPRETP